MRDKARAFMFVCFGVAAIIVALQLKPRTVVVPTNHSDTTATMGRFLLQEIHYSDDTGAHKFDDLIRVDTATGNVDKLYCLVKTINGQEWLYSKDWIPLASGK